MSSDLIVISNSGYTASQMISRLGLNGFIVTQRASGWGVFRDATYGECVDVSSTQDAKGEAASTYSELELKQIRELLPDPRFTVLSYGDIALVRDIVSIVANTEAVVVDNGFGMIASGREFISRLKENPCWDWRPPVPAPPTWFEASREFLIALTIGLLLLFGLVAALLYHSSG